MEKQSAGSPGKAAAPKGGRAGRGKSSAAIKRELREQLKAKDAWNAVSADLLEEYVSARGRLNDAKDAHAALIDGGGFSLADDAAVSLNEVMAQNAGIMVGILSALQITPKTERRQKISTEMREQLAVRGLAGTVLEDRVDTFLSLWDAFQDATKSLKARGRTYFTVSSAGKQYEKDNAAAKDVVAMSKAMGDILDELKITVDDFAEPDDAEL